MKTSCFSRAGKLWLSGLALFTAIMPQMQAKLFDGGVDSENLGKGDHIYIVGYATNRMGGNVPGITDIPSLMSYEKNQGMNYIVVKAGTGSTNYNGTGS